MRIIFCLALAYSYVLAYENSDEFINEINRKQNMWTAARNFDENIPISQIQKLLGAKVLPDYIRKNVPVMNKEFDGDVIPETFDARIQWSNCKTIKQVADQSACGSCWAVSVASAISDRICIHSNGKLQPEISANNIMTCACNSGCSGGYPYIAWKYFQDNGLVTGGQYGSNLGCQSYPFPQCEHHANGSRPSCPSELYRTPDCIKKCDNSSIDFSKDLHYGKSTYGVSHSPKLIQQEILKNGPVVAGFIVYADFIHYKSGVYFHLSGRLLGGHAVRVIGWGEENENKYWLVMNSWNDDWGDNGTFKILREVDECSFESGISAGLPA